MCPGHLVIHWRSFSLAKTLVETTFEGELCHTLLLLDDGTNLEESIGGTNIADARGGTAADSDAVLGLLDDFEVIGDEGTDLVVAGEEVRSLPEVVSGLGAAVLLIQVGALGNVSYAKSSQNLFNRSSRASIGAYPCHPRHRRRRPPPACPCSLIAPV